MFKLNCPNCHRIVRIPDARAEFLRETPCPVCSQMLQAAVKGPKPLLPAPEPELTVEAAVAEAYADPQPAATSSPTSPAKPPRKRGGH